MVDALSRAHRWLRDGGCLIDLRPADVIAHVAVGTPEGGWLNAGALTVQDERRLRHAAADLALHTVLSRRLFQLDSERTFDFFRYADSADDMREYVATKWRETRMGVETHARAVELHRPMANGRVRLTERVGIRRVRVCRIHSRGTSPDR